MHRAPEGGEVLMDCAAKGNPAPEIIWRKDQAQLSPQPFPRSSLALENLTATNSGRYTCEANNEAGTASADFVVEVLIRPRILNHQTDIRVIEGQSTKLECKMEGNPEPEIRWMRSGRPITDMSNFILSPRGDTLMILKTKRSDSGVFTCLAKNVAAEAGKYFMEFIHH